LELGGGPWPPLVPPKSVTSAGVAYPSCFKFRRYLSSSLRNFSISIGSLIFFNRVITCLFLLLQSTHINTFPSSQLSTMYEQTLSSREGLLSLLKCLYFSPFSLSVCPDLPLPLHPVQFPSMDHCILNRPKFCSGNFVSFGQMGWPRCQGGGLATLTAQGGSYGFFFLKKYIYF
jgi:hypothetical protein